MDFRTIIPPLKDHDGLIDYSHSIVMLGSCFTDNIGTRLRNAMFDCCVNPCGTLYNPASIASALLDILYERPYKEEDLFEHDGLWHSFNHHSRFSGKDRQEVLSTINVAQSEALESLKNASVLIITFGTSWIFRLASGNNVVANCHKMPPSMFKREMLTATQTYGLWKKMIRELDARFPELKLIFTVSPIRHLSDGAHSNQISKAMLLESIDKLVGDFNNKVIYFPAYEIMMDDLRDYRFYANDMVHPSDVAIEYIYDNFRHSFMDNATIGDSKICESLYRRLNHRPLNGEQEDRGKIIAEFCSKYPNLVTTFDRFTRIINR